MKRPVISASQLNQWAYCNRQWSLQHVLGWTPDRAGQQRLRKGTKNHEAHGRGVVRFERLSQLAPPDPPGADPVPLLTPREPFLRFTPDPSHAIKKEAGFRARRWVVERTHSWMNRFRAILIRWEKKAQNFLALLHLACAFITFKQADLLG